MNEPQCPGPECDRPVAVKGMCASHYQQSWAGRPLTKLRTYARKKLLENEICAAPHCEKIVTSRNLCRNHASIASRFQIESYALADILSRGCWNEACTAVYPLEIDHDHSCSCDRSKANGSCGKCIRGALCQRCNIKLSNIEDGRGNRDQDPPVYDGLVAYLNSPKPVLPDFVPIYKIKA